MHGSFLCEDDIAEAFERFVQYHIVWIAVVYYCVAFAVGTATISDGLGLTHLASSLLHEPRIATMSLSYIAWGLMLDAAIVASVVGLFRASRK